MAINVGRLVGLAKMYARLPDKIQERIGDELVYDIINVKMRELSGQVMPYETTITKDSVASTMEYELPESVITVKEVVYDSKRATKMTKMGERELSNEV